MSQHTTMQQMLGLQELRTPALYQAVAAEFLGTAVLIFASCASGYGSVADGVLRPAIATGLTLAALIQALGHISGGHINPSVTVGLTCARYTSFVRALLYITAQLIGGITGAGILYALVPQSYQQNLGVVTKNEDITEVQAFFTEAVLTFVFVFVVTSVSDHNRIDIKGSIPLAVGLTVVTNLSFGIPLSGGCMNSARAFGPAVIVGIWDYQWVYWVGPLLGGSLAGAVYSLVFSAPPCEHQEQLLTSAHFTVR